MKIEVRADGKRQLVPNNQNEEKRVISFLRNAFQDGNAVVICVNPGPNMWQIYAYAAGQGLIAATEKGNNLAAYEITDLGRKHLSMPRPGQNTIGS